MKQFLTYAPLIARLREGEYCELSIFAYGLTTSVFVLQKYTRKNGSINTYSSSIATVNGRMTIVVAVPVTETFANIAKIEVWAETASTRVTEIRTFIPDVSVRKKTVRIGWINSLGGADYYTFTGTRTSEVQSDKIQYEKDLPAVFTTADRGKSIASVTAFEEFEVISDFETEQMYQWMIGILTSPEVWLVEGSSIQPVIVTSKAHPVETDSMIQFRVKYRMANDKIFQNG